MKLKWDVSSPAFLSRLSSYLNDGLAIIRREFGLMRLFVRVIPGSDVCCTNGRQILFGALTTPMLDESISPEDRLFIVKGKRWHEIGHILFTPFSASKIASSAMLAGDFWPYPPATESLALREYIDKGDVQKKRLLKLYMEMNNVMEDGRIENCLLLYMYHYRGHAKALIAAREYFRKRGCTGKDIVELIKSFREDPDDPKAAESAYQACMSTILWLAKYGNIPEIEALQEDRRYARYVARIAPHISAAVDSVDDVPLFFSELNWVFCESSEYLLPYLKSIPDEEEGTGSVTGPLVEIFSRMGVSQLAEEPDPDGELEKATLKVKARAASEKAKKEEEKEKSEKKTPDPTEKPEAETPDKAVAEKPDGTAEETEDPEGKEPEAPAGTSEAGSEEESSSAGSSDAEDGEGYTPSGALSSGKIPDLSKVAEESPWGEADHPGSVIEEDFDDREEKGLDLEALLGGEESGPAPDPSADDAIEEALSGPTAADYGDINAGISWRIKRAKAVEKNDVLYESYRRYIDIGKIAAKKIKPFFNPERQTFYEKDRYCGTRLVTSKLSNPNLRWFAKKRTNPMSPSLAVAILVDESGSMHGSNIEAAKAATVSLYEMCRALNINFGVFGHTCAGYEVQITNYCYFDSRDPMDKYRLLKICAQRDNRDGAALRYVADLLEKQKADRRILIIISDGAPAAHGYPYRAAKEDMQQVVNDYERKGIKFIAAAIDSDKRAIEDIYGSKRFLDITDLEQLPGRLAAIVRKATIR